MILVDSSVWVAHLRKADARLQEMLNASRVLTHPFVIGELALGHLRPRNAILSLLQNLPCSIKADEIEVLDFINQNTLYGLGVGYVDAHLLASTRLTSTLIWTLDKSLYEVAKKLGLAYSYKQ